MAQIYGLTGGIAAGKSTVARLFQELGAQVVDADQLAREVVLPGTEGLAEICAAFGDNVLSEDGTLDRKRLGALVFQDDVKRRVLEQITHPRIAQRSMQRMAEIAMSDAPYGLYEAALLVEKGTHKMMAGLIVVASSDAVQLERVMRRDGLDEAGARARIASQMPQSEKVAQATWVIWNDGDLEALRARVLEVDHAIRKA
jgi:dephospho-CoA kinase